MASGVFDYMQVITVGAQLEVNDIGECCILGRDDLGQEYYLIITTYMGFTDIIEYGPALPDFEVLPKSVKYTFDRIDYSEFKIEKRIDKFLTGHPITYAEVTDLESIGEFVKAPLNYMRKL